MIKRTNLNALCNPEGVIRTKVDVMDQDLDRLHVDDGDQLGPVELLVAVLCQTGGTWDDTKATITAGNLNKHRFRCSFCCKSTDKVPTKEQKLTNVNVGLFLTRSETFQGQKAVDVCVDSRQSLGQSLFIHHILFSV